ncbi:MAG TPA: hypothetical protein VIS49_07135 [Cyclobacteriaceae bacterium]
MRKSKSSKSDMKAKGLSLLSVLVLLLVYLIGTVEVSSIHQLFHNAADKQILHSEVNEQNACHQVLYHHAKGKSCEHPTHITAFKRCSFCQLSIQSFHLFDTKSFVEFAFGSETMVAFTQPFQGGDIGLQLAPRAPPIS